MPYPCRAGGFSCDVAVVGGCGRVGLPLAIALADRGARVVIYDASEPAVAAVSAARMPFARPGSALPLERVVAVGQLAASADPRIVRGAEHVIVASAGAPPQPAASTRLAASPRLASSPRPGRGRHAAASRLSRASRLSWASRVSPASRGGPPADLPSPLRSAVGDCAGSLRDGQILILRSAARPGTTARLEKFVAELGMEIDVAFCPERTTRTQAVTEILGVPQIVSSRTERGLERARRLFARLTPALVPMMPEEAELATLFARPLAVSGA